MLCGLESGTMSDPIYRIDALTKNARTTWFALLGALIFVGVALMGIKHIDFYCVTTFRVLPESIGIP